MQPVRPVTDHGTSNVWEDLISDLKYALRGLYRNRRAALPAIVTIALGIGVNTAVFSLVSAVLIRPLPFADPPSLYAIWLFIPGFQGGGAFPPRARDFSEWRANTTPFTDIAALVPARFDLVDDGEPERLGGAKVSPNFFELLGVSVAVGRTFVADDGRPGRDQSVIISHALWSRRFARDPNVPGRTLRLNGEPVEVVGVLPASFVFPARGQIHPLLNFTSDIDIWRPLVIASAETRAVSAFDHAVIGRLGAQASPVQAASALERMSRPLLKNAFGSQFAGVSVRLVPFREIYVGSARQGLLVLALAAGLILIIACANVTNLLLARLAGRRAEIATRIAIGARRGRLSRQLLTESLLLVVAGAAIGVLLAQWALAAALARSPAELLPLGGVRIDATVMSFVVLLVAVTSIVVGLLPLSAFYRGLVPVILRPDEAPVAPMGGRRLPGASLIGVQVALTSIVLFVSLMLLHSYIRILRVDTGFRMDNVLTLDLALPAAAGDGRVRTFYDDVVARLDGMQGVASAAAVSGLPLAGVSSANPVLLEGDHTVEQILQRPVAIYRSVTPGYFKTMRIELRAGRLFYDSEPEPAAIVSVRLARALWPNRSLQDVVGQQVASVNLKRWRVVGVVEDAAEDALGAAAMPQIYRPYSQVPAPAMTVVVRASDRAAALAAPMRAAIREMDRTLPIPRTKTMDDVARESVLRRRFQLMTVLVFASLALALTLVGVYGVISYSVAQRAKEIGIRVACGAAPSDIVRHVLLRALRPTLIGLIIGIPSAIGAGWALRSVVFGVGMLDPVSVVGSSSLILLAAGVACYLPARRALRLDAVDTLRAN